MTKRQPLVVIAGEVQELPLSDSLPMVGVPMFVQDTAPVATGNYAWFQTNYVVPGGLTLWIEDGT